MRIFIGGLLLTAFFLVFVGVSTGDFYVEMLGTADEVPNPWDKEVALYIGAVALVLVAMVFTWVHDRTLWHRGEETFFPGSWLLL